MKIIFIFAFFAAQFIYCQENQIDSKGIGPVHFCTSLAYLHSKFEICKDTTLNFEEVEWKAVLIRQSDGSWILAESSWEDSSKVYVISTNSNKYSVDNKITVGSTLDLLFSEKYILDFNEGEGDCAFKASKDGFSFWFTIPQNEAEIFYQQTSELAEGKTINELLSPNSKIKSLAISCNCNN